MRRLVALCCAFLISVAPSAWATPPALGAAEVDQVIDRLGSEIEKLYVFPEKRAEILQALRTKQEEGAFAGLTPVEFVQRLNDALLAASNDKHLNVVFDPVRSTALEESPDPVDSSFMDAQGLRHNQGYVRQEILPGNIRYVRIQLFYWNETLTAPVIDAAAQFLSGGSAVIIDLRGNGGGHVEAVQRLISYLMPAKSVPLMTFYDGRSGESTTTRSTARLPADRITDRPVYVLVDRGSFSAAEEFAYHIQQFKLGTLVGETTRGGANNNLFVALPAGFVASISYGRAIHPVSKTNWEGVGITPDIEVPGPAALDAALIRAMETLALSPDPQIKAEMAWELPLIRARQSPVRTSVTDLRALVGTYGERQVRIEGERLISQRSGMPPLELAPIGDDLYAVVGIDDVRIAFVRNPTGPLVMEVRYRDGRKSASERE